MEKLQSTKENVEHCSFSAWYPTFKHLTIRSEIISLKDDEVAYLKADGLVVPEGCHPPQYAAKGEKDDSDFEDWEHDETRDTVKQPSFPDLVNRIDRSISSLGGSVFPKMNWSAPKDATWMSFNGTIRCTSPYDVFLLLKSSDFVTHDLTQPYKDCIDCDDIDDVAPSYEIVLRRWRTIIPGMEFRCFVKSHQLVGVCQRDDSAFYDYLKEEHQKQKDGPEYSEFVSLQQEDLRAEIQRFFIDNISGKFCDNDYVVDIYRRAEDTFWLIDFNPFSLVTDALLFTWDELIALQPTGAGSTPETDADTNAAEATSTSSSPSFEFRINRSQGVQPSPFLSNRLPKDIIDLSTGADINKFVDLFQSHNLGTDSDGD